MAQTDGIDNVTPSADIVKRAARLGAEIRNIDLAGDLPGETIAAINKVLLEHKVIFWDDRATQHYAVNDYGDQHRVVRRATVDGEVPVSIDSRHSVTRIKATKPQAAKAA